MKKRMLCALVLLIGVLIIGCDQSDQTAAAPETESEGSDQPALTIGVVVKTMGNPFFREIAYGAVQAGEDLGVEVIPLATARENQLDEQIRIVEDLMIRGVDALVVTPNHSEGIAPAVTAAHEAGIPFIAVDTAVIGEEVDSFIGMDNVEAGEVLAEFVAQELGGQGNVIILEGAAGASTSIDRTQGYMNKFAEYPGITVLASQNADFEQDRAAQVMADLLQAHSDVDAVVTVNDLMALGAMVALEEAGYEIGGEDGVLVGCYDISTAVLEEIQRGTIHVTGYHWGQLYGYWGVDMARRAALGEEIPVRITSPHSEITAENVEPFLEFARRQENFSFDN